MPRAVARAWVSSEGPWGLCGGAEPREYLIWSASSTGAEELAGAGADTAVEVVVMVEVEGVDVGMPCCPGGVGVGGRGTSCCPTKGGRGGVGGEGCESSGGSELHVVDTGTEEDAGAGARAGAGAGAGAASTRRRLGLTSAAGAAFSEVEGGLDMRRTSGEGLGRCGSSG